MQVQLTARHFYIIADEIQNYPTGQYFSLLEAMKAQLTGVTDVTQLITVPCSAEQLIGVYGMLGQKPETTYAQINQQMKQALLPQVQAGAIANDPAWLQVAQYVQGLDAQTDAIINDKVTSGKNFINS